MVSMLAWIPVSSRSVMDGNCRLLDSDGIGVGAGGQGDRFPHFQDWGIIAPLSAVI